ncbi:N-acetylglucosamine kinase [Flavimarina sp. Hel_I_48]|uniref:N-acetylglucosamine kinase n=1 Tax=Flavimarina sp. Hel_I_48 TaxID=1392488 RepID=UPI0004DF4881|nr:N-acetylglucosamine kinase [Flavimarina sp. Hel_I_48]
MILVVDSGSTKTDWIALSEDGEQIFQTQTFGLNPQVLSNEILTERIINNYELYKHRHEVTQLYFYGAGCGTEKPKESLREVFKDFFDKVNKPEIMEDTYAALYATTQREEPSIVCIIGTGSNCSMFNGENIEQKVTSLGYILMDDGSGNYYGRQLLRDFHFNKIPKDLAYEFAKEFDLTAESIKTHLYKMPNPNTYLAQFAKFLITNKEHEYCQKLIRKGLKLFIEHQILQFDNAHKVPVHFVGSIAFYLQEELKQLLKEYDLQIGKVLKRPIEGLVKYHKSYMMVK